MSTIKNGVLLSQANGMELITQCREVLDTRVIKLQGYVQEFSWLKLGYVKKEVYEPAPHWWMHKDSLNRYFDRLEEMLNRPDQIFISLLSYEHIIRLSKGDDRANAVFILNY